MHFAIAKPISKVLSKLFKKIFNQISNFHKKSTFYKNYNRFWIVQNSDPVTENMNTINSKRSFTYDVRQHWESDEGGLRIPKKADINMREDLKLLFIFCLDLHFLASALIYIFF